MGNTILNYKDSHPHSNPQTQLPVVVLVHGLFGSLDNLAVLARPLQSKYRVIQLDLRNHGRSFHHQDMTYRAMAGDIQNLMDYLNIEEAIMIGHSMGGKAVMKLADIAPQRVQALVVLDMAPVAYQAHRHQNVFQGISRVAEHKPTTRQHAMELLARDIELEGVRQFIGKSLYQNEDHLAWRFNYQAIFDNYHHIMGWEHNSEFEKPTFFVKGGDSDYIQSEHQAQIQAQFPQARAHIVPNTGHWLHAEKPEAVLRVIDGFLNKLLD